MKAHTLALLFGLAAVLMPFPSYAQLVIIANPNFTIESISKDDLRDIFTGASTNLRFGPRAKPVLLNKGKAHDEFLSTFVGVNDKQFHSDWLSLVFAGKMLTPPAFDSEPEVVDYVAHHVFTLGYIHKATPHAEVKTLTIR